MDESVKSFLVSFFSGGIGGIAAKTAIAPLERIKIIFQVSDNKFTYKYSLIEAKNIKSTEGFLGFFRGLLPTLMRIYPYAALQFALYDHMKLSLVTDNKSSAQYKYQVAFCGAVSGLGSSFIFYPLEVIKTRMSIKELSSHSMLKISRNTIKSEGLSGLYKGCLPAFMGIIVYKGFGFTCFESIKNYLTLLGEASQYQGFIKNQHQINWISGALGGTMGQVMSYPLDVVKKKMMVISERQIQRSFL